MKGIVKSGNKIPLSHKNIWKGELIEILVEASCHPYPNLYDEIKKYCENTDSFSLNSTLCFFMKGMVKSGTQPFFACKQRIKDCGFAVDTKPLWINSGFLLTGKT
jgi:ribosomal protein L31